MSVLVRFNPGVSNQRTVRRKRPSLTGGRVLPAAGLDYHVCSGATGRLKVTEKVQP